MVWLRVWPQMKGWEVGEAAVCSSRRVRLGGVPWPPGGSHGPLTRLQEAGSLDRAGLGRGGQQTLERRKAPCRPRSSPLLAQQACLLRGVPKQEQPLGTWTLLSPTFTITGAGE